MIGNVVMFVFSVYEYVIKFISNCCSRVDSSIILLCVIMSLAHFWFKNHLFWPSCFSVSSHFQVLVTTFSSVFLSTCPNHLGLASLIFSFMFATPALAFISSVLIFLILFFPTSVSIFASLFILVLSSMPRSSRLVIISSHVGATERG